MNFSDCGFPWRFASHFERWSSGQLLSKQSFAGSTLRFPKQHLHTVISLEELTVLLLEQSLCVIWIARVSMSLSLAF
ncbi:MAG: hypothetical protein ACK50R_03105 [Planctomycetota bacterium]